MKKPPRGPWEEMRRGQDKTDAAIDSAGTNANPEWKEKAYAAVVQTAKEMPTFAMYHVWIRFRAAWGDDFAFYGTLYTCALANICTSVAAAGLIFKTDGIINLPRGGPGRLEGTKGHNCDQAIWESKICTSDGYAPIASGCPTCTNGERFIKNGACDFCKAVRAGKKGAAA